MLGAPNQTDIVFANHIARYLFRVRPKYGMSCAPAPKVSNRPPANYAARRFAGCPLAPLVEQPVSGSSPAASRWLGAIRPNRRGCQQHNVAVGIAQPAFAAVRSKPASRRAVERPGLRLRSNKRSADSDPLRKAGLARNEHRPWSGSKGKKHDFPALKI